jgi:hypothetical protein
MRSNRQLNNGSSLFALPLLHPLADELKTSIFSVKKERKGSLLVSGRMPGYSSAPHLTCSGRGMVDRALPSAKTQHSSPGNATDRNSKPSGAL